MTETSAPRRAPRAMRRSVDDTRMPLIEHLRELRSRLFKSVLALAAGIVVAFLVFPQIFEVLQRPYCNLPATIRSISGDDCRLYYFGVLDGFLVRMQVSLVVGALLSSPVWLYQLAAFVTPGLHRRERRWAVPFVLCSMVLFAAGAVLAYLTIDNGLQFLLGISGDELTPILDAKRYLSFFTLVLLAFGVSFELPLLLVFLELVGVIDDIKLRRWRRGMYLGLAVFAAVITPSGDPFTFMAMWLPLVFFYEAVIVYARIHGRARRRHDALTSTDQWHDDETSPI